MGRTIGVVVVGAAPDHRLPLAFLGLDDDVALAPLAVRHRVMDFAFSTLHHARVRDVEIAMMGPGRNAAPYGAGVMPSGGPHRMPRVRIAPIVEGGRLRRTLGACMPIAALAPAATIVALAGDRLLAGDLQPVVAAHAGRDADVTLACLPALSVADGGGLRLDVEDCSDATDSPVGVCWIGGLVLRAGALPRILSELAARDARDDEAVAAVLRAICRVGVALPGATPATGRGAYWHEPDSTEAYYEAQMALCLPEPPIDLWSPVWPLRSRRIGTTPARVVSDAGHPAHVLNVLLGDGACIRGGEVVRSVVGAGVQVDVAAEVEDCILLDGCRIGRGAQLRRAIVGVGAVVGHGERIGYDATPGPAQCLPSGLTLIPPPGDTIAPAAVVR